MVCAISKTSGVGLSPTLDLYVTKRLSAALEKASVRRAGLSVSNPLSLYCRVRSLSWPL